MSIPEVPRDNQSQSRINLQSQATLGGHISRDELEQNIDAMERRWGRARVTIKRRRNAVPWVACISYDRRLYGGTVGTPQNYGLLEKKQAKWREDIDIMLGRRAPDTTHHEAFPSAYRAAARQPPPPPPAACLRPRRRYPMAEKTLARDEKELCIRCGGDPSSDDVDDQAEEVPCVDGTLAGCF